MPPFVPVLALALVVLCTASGCAEERGKPHIVLIVIDALRADKISCYGFPEETSPELDAWARRGVRFERAIAQSSWTRPSMASMLTSLWPRTLAITDERRHALSQGVETLPEVLQRHGYVTIGATANPNVNSTFHFDQGFDHHVDSDVVWAWMPRDPSQRIARDHPIQEAGEVFERVLEKIGDDARPHYVQVNVMEVHQAFKSPARIADLAERFPGEPDRPYLEALRETSRAVGAFVETLLARPGWENTLLVVTSDHGEGLSDHPDVPNSRGHGLQIYESQMRVPLLFYDAWEGEGSLPSGRVVSRPVRLLDLMPTLLDFAGVPGPEDMQGVSLLPLLEGEDAALPDVFVVETRFRRARKAGAYTDEWKYIENRDRQRGVNPRALHAVGSAENGTRTDVAASHPEVMARLRDHLARWEAAHPPAEPTAIDGDLSEAELEQLRTLGYLK